MNRKAFFILMAAFAIFGLGSCLSTKAPVDARNSRTSLDWEGVYTGTIPAASGPGINVRLKINEDESFELKYEYLDKPENPSTWTGSFKWDDAGNIITLDIKDVPPHYKAEQNKLIQLDMEGKPISGNLADNYVLKKEL
jgi:uncharacterized lipoprotein NlpE involved in copper resistance